MKKQTLGERIRAARLEKGLTQDQLAQLSGVSARTIREAEADKRTPQQAKRLAIFAALGLEGGADDTRSEWPVDIDIYLDVIGQSLSLMTVEERRSVLVDVMGLLQRKRSGQQGKG